MKQRGKIIKRNRDNLRDNVKCPNIRSIGVQKEEDRKKEHEILVQNFF